MIEIPDAKTIVESQLLQTLAKVRQSVAAGVTLEFEGTYEPPDDTGVSYWGEALVEFIAAYLKGTKIAVLVWVKRWDFPEQAMEELWNQLCQRLYEKLTSRIPDLKWFNLEIRLLDSIEPLEKAAFLSQDFP